MYRHVRLSDERFDDSSHFVHVIDTHYVRLGRLWIRLFTRWEIQQVILKKKGRKNSDSLMGIELMTPDLTLSQEVLDYE